MPSPSRRQFLQAGAAAALTMPLVAGEPVMGMIFPPADYPVPPEAEELYPHGVKFLAEGLGFKGMTIEGYNEAVPRIVPAALKRQGVSAEDAGKQLGTEFKAKYPDWPSMNVAGLVQRLYAEPQ